MTPEEQDEKEFQRLVDEAKRREQQPPKHTTNGNGHAPGALVVPAVEEVELDEEDDSWERFCIQAEEDEAQEWLFKPYIPPRGLVIVAGEQKSGKTLWVAWAVSQVLKAGKRVLFIELEGSRGMLKRRCNLFLGADRSGLRVRWRVGGVKLDVAAGVQKVVDMARYAKADLVVIDPLVRAMEGDENEARVIRNVIQGIEAIGKIVGAPIVVIHHVRKASKEGRDSVTAADVRGSSVLTSGASVVIMVQKKDAADASTARFDVVCDDSWYEKFDDVRCVVDFKARSPEEAMAMLSEDDADEAAAVDRKREKRTRLRVAILNTLAASFPESQSQNEVEGNVSGTASQVRDALKELVAECRISLSMGPNRSKQYRYMGPKPDSPPQPPTTAAPPLPVSPTPPHTPDVLGASVSVSTHSDAPDAPLETVAKSVGASSVSLPLGETHDTPPHLVETHVYVETEEGDGDAVHTLHPLAQCVKRVGGVQCPNPIHGDGVWCRRHIDELLGVTPPPTAAATPPEAAPSPPDVPYTPAFRELFPTGGGYKVPVQLEPSTPALEPMYKPSDGTAQVTLSEPVSAPSATPRPVSSWEDIP